MLKRDGPVSTAKLSLVRKINYNTVWEYLLSNNEDSISGIAKNVGLSFPTVNRAIEYGLSINLIESGTIENTSFGRKPQTYKLNDKYAHNLAIFVDNKKSHTAFIRSVAEKLLKMLLILIRLIWNLK